MKRDRVRRRPARPRGGGSVGAVEARSRRGRGRRPLAARTSGRSAPAATGTSPRPGELEHPQRVGGRLGERLVAGDGRDAEQLELGRGQREQDRDRVVVAGVAVEDDAVGLAAAAHA